MLEPADMMEIEIYSDEEIDQWDKEDGLEPVQRDSLLMGEMGSNL